MTAYIITAKAKPDPRSVIRYTRAQWNTAQVRRYISLFERGIVNLAEGKVPLKDMSALHPALRMARCQHRLPPDDAPALIVAVLHERMDLMKRLADRLND